MSRRKSVKNSESRAIRKAGASTALGRMARLLATRRTVIKGIGATAMTLPLLARAGAASNVITVTDATSGKSFTYDPSVGDDLGNFVAPGFTQRCIRVRNASYPLVIYFRPDLTSSRQEFVFELGTCWNNPPIVDLGPYTVTIPSAGVTINVPKHYWFTRWRWQSAARPLIRTPSDIFSAKLFPPISASVANVSSPPTVSYSGPMDSAGIFKAMPTTGDRPDIGLCTEWQAYYLATGDSAGLQSALAQGEGSASIQWHFRDENTGAPINFYDHPEADTYGRDVWNDPNEHINFNDNSGFTMDVAHMPDLWYVPYLLTNDPYYLEEGQFALTYVIGFNRWWRDQEHCPVMYPPGQVRSWAWALRTGCELAKVTPANVPQWLLPQSYYQKVLDDNLAVYTRMNVDSSYVAQSVFHASWVFPDGDGLIHTFMESYLDCANALAVYLGFTEYRSAATWARQLMIALSDGKSGWPRNFDMPYNATGWQTADNWSQFWENFSTETHISGSLPAEPKWGQPNSLGYLQMARASFAMGALVGDVDAAACLSWVDTMIGANNAPVGYKYAFADAGPGVPIAPKVSSL